ncbi:hypothetical protein H0B56_17135 [Haloechinothrix sp. YIM 98757]|uniref:Flp pilus-assembly TadE/G-like n=1 Tax=Haloechinothrix aidingensis TaxID=2752311 RepID=A0A838ADK9_9PSEU|nr:hypothetical protein [Haloechinothrix aidingensis]
MTVLAAVLLPALLLTLALVVDGAGHARAISQADSTAAEAARAAHTALDTRGATITVDPDAAIAAARTYLARRGHTGTVRLTSSDTVTVTVTVTTPAVIGLLGTTYTATGTATAQLSVGASDPGD